MGTVVAEFTMSLDGYIAAADGSVIQLYYWYFSGDTPVTIGDGIEARVSPASAALLRQAHSSVGAVVSGRRLFDTVHGWGGRHPCDVPCFVVTHRAPDHWTETDTSFTFVTSGVEHAVAQAKIAAAGRRINVGGASVAQQCLNAGLLDELHIHLVPVLLGAGVRLFEGLNGAQERLGQPNVIDTPEATHLLYRVIH